MVSRYLAAALVLALAGPGFDGCQGGTSDAVVPTGNTVACFTDTDCVPTACEDLRCIASECMVVSAMRDADMDGHAPPPCGDDCDDHDMRVFPGQAELCDNRDQDCDGIVDEDAAPGAISTLLGTASMHLAAAAVGDSIVVTDTTFATGVRLRAIDFDGHVGAGVPVLTDAITVLDVGTTETGGVVAIGRMATDFVLETYPIEIAAGVLVVHPVSMTRTLTSAITRVRAEPVGASFVIVWDDDMLIRWALMPQWAAPVQIGMNVAMSVPFDAASDGTTIVIPTNVATAGFFAVADGATVAMQTFASGLAFDPVTVGASDYIVGFRDAFDHELAHMTTTTISAMRTAPSQGSGLPLRIDETPLGPLLTRFDPTGARRVGTGVWALLIPETLDAVRVDFPPSMVSAGIAGNALDFDVVASSAGTAVLTNFGTNGAVLTVLACQPH